MSSTRSTRHMHHEARRSKERTMAGALRKTMVYLGLAEEDDTKASTDNAR